MTLKQRSHAWLMLLPLQPHRSSLLPLNIPGLSLPYTFAHAVSSACQHPSPSSLCHKFFQFNCPAQKSLPFCGLPQLPRQKLLLSWALSALTSPHQNLVKLGWNGRVMSSLPRRLWRTKHVPGTQWELSKWMKSPHRNCEEEYWFQLLSLLLLSPKLN